MERATSDDRRCTTVDSRAMQVALRGCFAPNPFRAGLTAAVALGHLRWEDIPARIQIDQTFEPERANRRTYDDLFKAFVGLYKQNKGIYAKLNASLYRDHR